MKNILPAEDAEIAFEPADRNASVFHCRPDSTIFFNRMNTVIKPAIFRDGENLRKEMRDLVFVEFNCSELPNARSINYESAARQHVHLGKGCSMHSFQMLS